MSWATPEFCRRHWPDSDVSALPDATLAELLTAALPAVRDYAPALAARTFTDGVTVAGSPELLAATGAFASTDLGRAVAGAGIPAGATIVDVVDASSATLSAAATADATAVSVTVSGVPTAWRMAHMLHTRELAAAAKRDGELIGVDGLAVRTRPLIGAVKALLRPARGVPEVG